MCIFCKIIAKEIQADIVYEDQDILAFKDVHPLAPVHVLIIPKKHIPSINEVTKEDREIMGNMILVARQIASDLQVAENGYKLLIRTGKDGGQEVPHIHLHLIGGANLYEEIRPV
jgi:histidine triad (HIT) family protein